MVELNRLLEFRETRRVGAFFDLLLPVEIFENLLRCAERLLKDIVDPRQPLDRLIQHQQGDDETGEFTCAHRADLDPIPRVGHQAHDGERTEEIDQRRRDGLLADIAQIAAAQPHRPVAEAVRFHFFRAE